MQDMEDRHECAGMLMGWRGAPAEVGGFGRVLGAGGTGVGASAVSAYMEELARACGATRVVEIIADHIGATEHDGAASTVSGLAAGGIRLGVGRRQTGAAKEGGNGLGRFGGVGLGNGRLAE